MSGERRVLLARTDSAGDVLLTGPAVRAVAASGARVHYLCGPRGEAAARLLPGIAEMTVQHIPWIDAEPEAVEREAMAGLVRRLAGLALDEAVIFTSFHQSPLPLALLLRMAGVGRIAAISHDHAGSLLDVRHRIHDDFHEVERNLSLVGTLGHRLPPGDGGRLAVSLPADARSEAVLRAAGEYVVVHPGASVTARAWAPGLMAELVDLLARRGRQVVVTGGASERSLTAHVAGEAVAARARPGTVVDFGGRTDLAGLGRVLAGARVVVVGNTGPAHLAAAVGTPVVSLFAPTVPAARWRPWGVPHVLLGHQEIGCAGCRARTCPRPGHPCLGVVDPAEVAAAVDDLCRLGTTPAKRDGGTGATAVHPGASRPDGRPPSPTPRPMVGVAGEGG